MSGYRRLPLDIERYMTRSRTSPCFICKVVAGSHEVPHHEVHRDDVGVAFLARFPTLVGYTLVAPIDHRRNVVGDFTEDEYAALQRLVYRVGRAVSEVVPTERLYVLSLGSHQGNAHVHWHIAPLPPGVPYEEQQFHALMAESQGYLDIPDAHQAALAGRIRAALSNPAPSGFPDRRNG